MPNLDPTNGAGGPIFNADGSVVTPGPVVGATWPGPGNPNGLFSECSGDCSGGNLASSPPVAGQYYPGLVDATDFPAPVAQDMPTGPSCATLNSYQMAVAGCVLRPISCGVNSATNPSSINIDTTTYTSNTGTRDSDTVQAVSCLIHYNGGLTDADSIDLSSTPFPPHEFIAGQQNPIAGARRQDVMVSDSLVTIPVIDTTVPPTTSTVNVIGFCKCFWILNRPLSP